MSLRLPVPLLISQMPRGGGKVFAWRIVHDPRRRCTAIRHDVADVTVIEG
jgi:hypothetical protein